MKIGGNDSVVIGAAVAKIATNSPDSNAAAAATVDVTATSTGSGGSSSGAETEPSAVVVADRVS